MRTLFLTIFLIVTVSSIVAVYFPTRQFFIKNSLLLKQSIIEYLEEKTNRKISLNSIEPGFLNYLSVKDLVLSTPDGKSDNLRFSKVKIYYDIFSVLKGDIVSGLREIRLENSVIRLEEKRDQDIIKLVSEQLFTESKQETSLKGVVVSAKNLDISYQSSSGSIRADKVFFKMLLGSDEYELSLNACLKGRLPDSLFHGAAYDADLRVRATIEPSKGFATARIEFPEFKSDVITIYDQNFQVLLQNDSLNITKVFDSLPLDLQGEINLESGDMKFSMEAENYVPAASFRVGDEYSNLDPWLTTSINGKSWVSISGKTGIARYESNLDFYADNEYLNMPVKLSTRIKGDSSRADIRKFRISSGAGQASYEGSLLLDRAVPVPDGTLSIKNVRYFGGYYFNGDILFTRHSPKAFTVSFDRLNINSVIFSNGAADIALNRNGFDFLWQNDFYMKEKSHLEAGGTVNLNRKNGVLVKINSDNIPGPVLGIAVPSLAENSFVEDSVLNLALELNTDFKGFSFSVPRFELLNSSNDFVLLARVRGNSSDIALRDVSLSYKDFNTSADADISLKKGNIGFSTSLALLHNDYFLHGSYSEPGGLKIEGNNNLLISYKPGSNRNEFLFTSDRLPVQLKEGHNSYLSANISGWHSAEDGFMIRSAGTRIFELPVPVPENEVVISGVADEKRVIFSNLSFSDKFSTVKGIGGLYPDLENKKVRKAYMFLKEARTGEQYEVHFDLDVPADFIESKIYFTRTPFDRLGIVPVSGNSSGRVLINGKLSKPRISVTLREFNASYKIPGFETDTNGSAELADLLGNPDTDISLSKIESNISLGDFSASLLASARLQNPQKDPELDLNISKFSGSFNPSYLSGNFLGNAELKTHLLESEQKEIIGMLKDGLKMQAVRDFLAETITKNEKLNTELKTVLSVKDTDIHTDKFTAGVTAEAGIVSTIMQTDIGVQLHLDNARADFNKLAVRLNASLESGGSVSGDDLVRVMDLIKDGMKFREIISAYSSEDFGEFRKNFFSDIKAENVTMAYSEDNMEMNVAGNVDASLARGLLALSAQGLDVQVTTVRGEKQAYVIPAKMDLSGHYNSDELLEIADFLETVDSLQTIQAAIRDRQLPQGFWKTYFSILVEEGLIALGDDDNQILASVYADVSGTLDNIAINVQPEIDGKLVSNDGTFKSDIKGSAQIKAEIDNRIVSEVLEILAGKMSIKELNKLLSWAREPDVLVQLVLENGKIENSGLVLPLEVKANLNTDLTFVGGEINASIENGQIKTGNFTAMLSSYIRSAVQGRFVNFDAVLAYLDSKKKKDDVYSLIESLFSTAETNTKITVKIDEGQYRTDIMDFPVSAEFALDTDINKPEMREILFMGENKPDINKIIKQVSGLSEDAAVQDAAKEISLSILDNRFNLKQLEAAFRDYPDLASVLSAQLDAEIKIDNGKIILPWLDASVDIEARFTGELRDPQSRILVRFTNTRVTLDQFQGIVNAAVSLQGSLEQPRIELDFGDTYGKLLGREFTTEGKLVSFDNTITMEEYSVRYDFLKLKKLNGFWNLDSGQFSAEGGLGGGFAGYPLSGEVSIDMQTAPDLKMSEIYTFAEQPLKLSVSASDIRLGENYRDSFAFDFESDNNGFYLASSDEYIFDFSYKGDCEINVNYERNDTKLFLEAGENQELYEASLSVENFSLDFLKVLSNESAGFLFSFLSQYTLNTSALYREGLEKYSFALPNFSLANGEDSIIRIQASGNDDQITVNSVQFKNFLDNMYGTGSVSFDDKGFHLAGQLSFNSENYRVRAEGMLNDFIFYGSHGLTGHAGFSRDKFFYSILLNDLILPFDSQNPTTISLKSSGRYRNNSDWKIDSLAARVENIPLLVPGSSAVIDGKADSSKGGSVSIKYSDIFSELNGEIKADFTETEDDVEKTVMLSGHIDSNQEDENYLLDARIKGRDTLGILSFAGFPVNRIPGYSSGGYVDGELLINANNGGTVYDFSVNLTEAEFLNNRLSGSVHGIYNGTALKLSEGNFAAADMSFNDLSAQIDTSSGSMALETFCRARGANDIDLSGKIDISADFATDFRSPPLGELLLANLDGKIDISNFTIDEMPQKDWNFRFARAGTNYNIEGGPGNGISGSFSEDGSFRFDIDDSLPVSLHAAGNIENETIEANITDIDVELPYFKYFIEIPFLKFTGGSAAGNLRIAGSLSDPDFFGEFKGREVYLKTDFVPEELGPVEPVVSLNEKEMYIPFTITDNFFNNVDFTGNFQFERWVPSYYSLTFKSMDNRGIHIEFPVASLDTNGYVTGIFNVEGDMEGAKMTGNLTVFNCIITELEEHENESMAEKPLFDTIVDLKLKTGRNVSIKWPRNPEILEASARIGQDIEIMYDSSHDSFSLKGNIEIQTGTILWFQRNFYIKKGKLVFNETGDFFDPRITAKAELLEVSPEGERVRIYLDLHNDSLNNMTPSFSAQPYLSRDDISQILGSNTFRNEDDEITLESTTMTITDIVSQLTIIRGFEKRIQNLLNLDLFSIRTQMIQNVLFSRVFNDEGALINVDPLSRYLDNTTLFFGKQLTNEVYLEALVILSANEYNAAIGSDGNSLNIESELSLEWFTPLFLLDFSFQPDMYSLDDSLNSINLGLFWDFQF